MKNERDTIHDHDCSECIHHWLVDETEIKKGGTLMAKTIKTKLQPLGDRIIVRPIQKEKMTKGGIVLPDTAKEKPQEGEVLAVGPGKLTEEGNRLEMEVKAGDKVIYAKYSGTEFKENDEELLIIRDSDVLAKIGS